MRQIRRYFVLFFVTVTLISALHEIIHDHHHSLDHAQEESCFLYTHAQTPLLLSTSVTLEPIATIFEPFQIPHQLPHFTLSIPAQNRSPPIS